MGEQSRQDYFDYVQQVLGVRSVLLSSEEPNQVTQVKESSNENSNENSTEPLGLGPILVGVENLNSYTADEKFLLDKMLTAVQLPAKQFQLKEISLSLLEQSLTVSSWDQLQLCILFLDQPKTSSVWKPFLLKLQSKQPSLAIVATYSPHTLQMQPDLKKQAWSDLQAVLKFLKTST